MCCRSEWQERMYIYKWHEVDQTKHEIFCVHIVCNEIQVKVNLEITTFFFYLRFPYCPNFFWFGVVDLTTFVSIWYWCSKECLTSTSELGLTQLLQSAAIRESPGQDQQTEGQLHPSGCQEAELPPVLAPPPPSPLLPHAPLDSVACGRIDNKADFDFFWLWSWFNYCAPVLVLLYVPMCL